MKSQAIRRVTHQLLAQRSAGETSQAKVGKIECGEHLALLEEALWFQVETALRCVLAFARHPGARAPAIKWGR